MKRSFINIISVLLVLVALIGAIPVSISAAKDKYPNTHINTGDQRVDIVSIAKTQVGFREGDNNDTKYGSWYGLPNQPWCAMFVSWCAREAQVPLDILRNCAIASPEPGYFDIPFYDGEEYTPKQGDLFFTKTFSHVGLVDYIDGEYFYTVEGNTNDNGSNNGIGVFTLKRKISDYYFGVPDYNYISENHTCTNDIFISYSKEHPHYATYRCSLCAKLTEDASDVSKRDDCAACSAPSKPVIECYNDPFFGDDAVTFHWQEAENATYYDFALEFEDGHGHWQEYETVYGAESGFTWRLSEGRYRCLLTAYNLRVKDDEYPEGIYTQSEYREFSVDKVLYTVTYVSGTEDEVQTVTKQQGLDLMITAAEPMREGYLFLGWATDADAKRPVYTTGSLYKEDASVVLYAVWRDENATALIGDVNGDNIVNIKDVTAIQKHLAGLSVITEKDLALADCDQNGNVNIKDATAIQKHIAGIMTEFPIGDYYI